MNEFLLIPYGRMRTERAEVASFSLSPENARALVSWFGSLGRKLAIDYNHQSVAEVNNRPDGLAPAAGWIGGLSARRDGLWATNVEWTAKAAAALASGEYKYFSPVIFWADKTHTQIKALGPVALTNDPAMTFVAPLVASRALVAHADRLAPRGLYQRGGPQVDQIKELLGLPADASDDDVIAAVKKMRSGGGGGGGSGGGAAGGVPGGGSATGGGVGMQAQALAAELKLEGVTDEATLLTAIQAKIAAASKPDAAILERITKLETDNGLLRKQNADAEFETCCATGAGKGKITPAMKDSMRALFHADRTNFDKLVATLPAIGGDKSVFEAAPAKPVNDREKTILSARTQFAEEKAGPKTVLASELDYVNLALRDLKLPKLSEDEVKKHSIQTE